MLIAWIQNSLELYLLRKTLTSIDLQVFADASIADNCSPQIVAVVYTVVYQPNLVNQVLVTNESRISKHNITIPRPELVSTYKQH